MGTGTSTGNTVLDVTVDGVTNSIRSWTTNLDSAGANNRIWYPATKFDESLTIDYYADNGRNTTVLAWVKTPSQIIDDFNDNNLSEYRYVRGDSETTSDSFEGQYAYWRNDTIGNGSTQSYQGDGLNYYPKRGDVIEFYGKATNVGNYYDTELTVGLQNPGSNDTEDCYSFLINLSDDNITIGKWSGGNNSTLNSKNVSLSLDTWYRHVVYWKGNGDLVYEVRDSSTNNLIKSVSATDSEYDEGGLGLRSTTGGYLDFIRKIK
jgi:hypothetical protein